MRLQLHWQILIALALAVVAGSLTDTDGRLLGLHVMPVYEFVGSLFLNALKMIIVPLVAASIITGVGSLGGGSLGRLGGKTILYYLTTSTLAICIGLAAVNIVQPGVIDGAPANEVLGLQQDAGEITERVAGKDAGDIVEIFLRMFPPNIVSAASDNGQLLGIIVFSLLFGYFMARIERDQGQVLGRFFAGVFEVMMRITHLVMRFSPIGVFALVAKVVSVSGLQVFGSLLAFFLTVLGALLIHLLIVLPLILRFVGGVSPWRHFRAMAPALLTAFSTSSSSATLPITMDCVERRAGVSNRTSSFVLPLGATVNMDGTALYECVAVLFIAQAYGVDLSLAQQLLVVILALLTSVGVAGIPSASLVAIVVILGAFGLPAEAIALIFAVDRLLDMSRTSVNVFSDSCGAVVIARSEGERDILKA
jgi:Na+/H+-dicarboxylate symporter